MGCSLVCVCVCGVCVCVCVYFSMWPFSIWCGTDQRDRGWTLHMLLVTHSHTHTLTHTHTYTHTHMLQVIHVIVTWYSWCVGEKDKGEGHTCDVRGCAFTASRGFDCCSLLFHSLGLSLPSVLLAHLPQSSAWLQPSPGDTQTFLFLVSSPSEKQWYSTPSEITRNCIYCIKEN